MPQRPYPPPATRHPPPATGHPSTAPPRTDNAPPIFQTHELSNRPPTVVHIFSHLRVSKKPHKYCKKTDTDGIEALTACSTSCDTCGCTDEETWHRAGKPSKGCDYVAKKPSKYCDYEGEDGTFAFESW